MPAAEVQTQGAEVQGLCLEIGAGSGSQCSLGSRRGGEGVVRS